MFNCIEHNQKGNRDGYGSIRVDGERIGAHRYAYCFARGIDPKLLADSVVRHTCDNSRCINPEHLILGTHQDNAKDMLDRGRNVRGVSHGGAELTEKQVHAIRAAYVPRSAHANQTILAKAYGVSQGHITRILTGRSWAHV